MLRDNILADLFWGDISPSAKRHTESERTKEYQAECKNHLHQLKQKLSDDDIAVLEQIMVDRTLIESESIRQGFEDGFRMGVRILLAALTEE